MALLNCAICWVVIPMTNKPPFDGERIVAVKDVFDLQMGKTPSRDVPEYWNNGDHDWVSIKDLGSYGKYVGPAKETISDLGVIESRIKAVPADTLIMSFKLSLGKTAITKELTYTNEAIMAFLDKGSFAIDLDYMYHQFSTKDWTAGTNTAVMGKTLNKKTLGASCIVVPAFEAQHEIATRLDSVCEQIELAQEQLTALDSLVKSRFVEMFGDPINNNASWPRKPINDFCELRIGPFGSSLHKRDYIEGGHALINPSHIVNGAIAPDMSLTISDERYAELDSYHLEIGDVVLGRRGEIGRCAVVCKPGLLCGTGCMIVRPNAGCRPDYLQRVISFPSFKDALEANAVGQTMKNLNANIVGNAVVTLPPINVQNEFARFASHVDKLRVAAQKQKDELQALYDSLAQDYFAI
jgi:type I restriction enzyme S subunit